MRKIIPVLLAVASFFCCSCNPDTVFDRDYLKEDGPGLVVDDVVILKYEPQTCQMAYNRTDSEYSVFKDDMSEYFIVRLGGKPKSKGQKIQGCSLTWTSSDNISNADGLTFKVEAVDSDGKVWLWESSQRIVLILRSL